MVVHSSFLRPREGIRHEEPNTVVFINNREVGKGTLYITESVLSWVDSDAQQGFSLEYPHISVHAVARDDRIHPKPCLYIVIDVKIDMPDMSVLLSENGSENEDDDTDPPMTHMQFMPDNTDNLQLMFQAMGVCQGIHCPSQITFSDEDVYEDAEEDYEGEYDEDVGAGDAPCILPTGHMGTNHTGTEAEEAMDIEAGQFEDAEEDP